MKQSVWQIGLYLGGGGLLLSWLNPPEGLGKVMMVGGVILLLALIHNMLNPGSAGMRVANEVASMKQYRTEKKKTAQEAEPTRDKNKLQSVFHTFSYDEVEQLVEIMRAKGLRPMMVTQSKTGDFGEPVYQIMLPEAEVKRGKALAKRFPVKTQQSS